MCQNKTKSSDWFSYNVCCDTLIKFQTPGSIVKQEKCYSYIFIIISFIYISFYLFTWNYSSIYSFIYLLFWIFNFRHLTAMFVSDHCLMTWNTVGQNSFRFIYCFNRGATQTPRTNHMVVFSTQLNFTTVKFWDVVKFGGWVS